MSDDNAYAEIVFRTAKYRPEFSAKGLPTSPAPAPGQPGSCMGTTSSIATAASATPARRSANDGKDHAILAARHAVHTEAKAINAARWSGKTRNGSPINAVTLNPERDAIINAHLEGKEMQPLAA